MNFSGKFGSDQTIWYPASGFRGSSGGGLNFVGLFSYFWSASTYDYDYRAYYLHFVNYGNVDPSDYDRRACGLSVRCLQE